jgi:uncharacterized protein
MDSQSFEQAKQYVLHRLENELSPGFYYHSPEHTKGDVVPAAARFAAGEAIQDGDLTLLLTAAWFHDLGFIETRAGHEIVGVRFAAEALPGFGYNPAQIQTIKGIILATIVPQNPLNHLEQIMADADLDVLGRTDFMQTNENLRRELAFFGKEFTDLEWFSGQLEFVETHRYFTETARSMRNETKAQNILDMKKRLALLE